MRAPHLFGTTVLCLALVAGATACTVRTGPAAAPAAPALASPSASPSPTATGLAALGPEEISDRAGEALLTATALRVKGLIRTDEGPMLVDLAIDAKKACTGSITMGGVGQIELISTGGRQWLKANREFWENVAASEGAADKEAVDLLEGRYLTGFADDPDYSEMFEICDLRQLTEETVSEEPGATATYALGPAGEVRGVRTISVTENLDGEETVIHVAAEGTPYPLRLEMKGAEGGRLDFTDFDKPFTVTPPPAAEVIDLAQFEKELKAA